MARSKKPISYDARFADGIIRSADVVEQELSELEGDVTVPTSERSNGRTTSAQVERAKTRHSFDVYRDQITALTRIQTEMFEDTGKKPKLGELVQEALDRYIAEYKEEKANG